MLDQRIILHPIGDNNSCGPCLRDLEKNNIYLALKDKRIAARRDERNTGELFSNEITRQWKEINNVCIEILSYKSKDLDVICWLIEAQLRIYGFSGLNDAFKAANSLIKAYWSELHPVEYENLEDRIASFTALNGKGSSGGLLQALRLAPLIPDIPFGQYGLWDYMKSHRAEQADMLREIIEASAQAGQPAMLSHLETITCCLEQLNELAATLDLLCAGNSPRMTDIGDLLHDAVRALRDINAANHFHEETIDQIQDNTDLSVEHAQIHKYAEMKQFQNRQEALQTLFSVAEYFRKTEPNSPLAPALETLVRRSNLNFAELLQDLMPDQSVCTAVLSAAGITTETINYE